MSIVYRTILEPEEIEKFRELIFLYTINHNNDLFSMCTLWNGPVNRDGYGFVRVTFRGCRKILTAHRLAYYISHSSHYLIPNMHVSHLCHNKLCVNLQHLSYESDSVNKKREICKHEVECKVTEVTDGAFCEVKYNKTKSKNSFLLIVYFHNYY